MKNKFCHCGKESVLGLKPHIALCSYHCNRYMWGNPRAQIFEKPIDTIHKINRGQYPKLNDYEQSLIKCGFKMGAIEHYKAVHGLSLDEAKMIINAHIELDK